MSIVRLERAATRRRWFLAVFALTPSLRSTDGWRRAALLFAAAATVLYTAGLLLLPLATPQPADSEEPLRIWLAVLGVVAGAAFLGFHAASLGRPTPLRRLVWLLLAGLAVRIALLFAPVVLETDHYRYLWDGAVVAHGLDPYGFSPEEVRLGQADVPLELRRLADQAAPILGQVNHPWLTTIYPPLAQAAFAAAHLLSPYDIRAWRVLLLVADLAAVALLLLLLREARLPAAWVGLYWLNPLPLRESYVAAHLDLLGVPLVLTSLWLLLRRRWLGSAALMAMATAVKPWPVVLLPLLLRQAGGERRAIAAALTYAVVGLLLWLPMLPAGFAIGSGWQAYAGGWQANTGAFGLLVAILDHLRLPPGGPAPALAARLLVAGILVVVTLRLSWSRSVDAREFLVRAGTVVATVFLLIPSPFPWYYTWVLPFLVFRPLGALAAYSALLPLYYVHHRSPWILVLEHGPVWISLGVTWWRSRCDASFATAASQEVL
ncbi:MAG: glycosyltransferase 87 family protein [Candidatus Binatia bacterium]